VEGAREAVDRYLVEHGIHMLSTVDDTAAWGQAP